MKLSIIAETQKTKPKSNYSKIEKIIKTGKKSGAIASKLLGAGGGGFILFYVNNSLLSKFKKNEKI